MSRPSDRTKSKLFEINSVKLQDEQYINKLNTEAVDKESNINFTNIMDKSLKNILEEFTNKILMIIDGFMTDIEESNQDNEMDGLDWVVYSFNLVVKMFQRIMEDDNPLYVGILIILISIFIHFFNITNNTNIK